MCRTTTDPVRMELSRHISTWMEMGERHMDRFRLHSYRTCQKQKHALYASSNYFITIGSAEIECSLLKAAIVNYQYHRYHLKMLKYRLISHQQTTCNRLINNKLLQTMRMHPNIRLLITRYNLLWLCGSVVVMTLVVTLPFCFVCPLTQGALQFFSICY